MTPAKADEFKPDVAALRALATSINTSLDAYESANGTVSESIALSDIVQTAQRLKLAATPPRDAFADFTFAPLANGCVRIAIAMGLFDHLPTADGSPGLSIEEISTRTETELELTSRVVRGLVAFDILHLDDASGLYTHTGLSRIYTDPTRRAYATWIFDVVLTGATRGLARYFDAHGDRRPLTNPREAGNAPFALAYDAAGQDIFEIVKGLGKATLLNVAMSGSSVVCARDAVAAFDFATLRPGDGGVVLVDVGGARGQTIREIRHTYPSLTGTVVLQDLASVLEGGDGPLPGLDAQVVPYDFFKQEQPVRGAGAYYYQRIFHDWGDADCARILESLRPAMASHSKLLICDVVVQDVRPHPRKVLRDINMLMVGGMERSQKQWETLLERAGFAVVSFHGLDNTDNSIIEARLR